jgi:hypothetical protein
MQDSPTLYYAFAKCLSSVRGFIVSLSFSYRCYYSCAIQQQYAGACINILSLQHYATLQTLQFLIRTLKRDNSGKHRFVRPSH